MNIDNIINIDISTYCYKDRLLIYHFDLIVRWPNSNRRNFFDKRKNKR